MRWASLMVLVATGAWAQDFLRIIANTTSENEVCVTWGNRRIVYVVDAAGSARTPAETEYSAITQSFATWQVVSDGCSDFTFSGGPRQDNIAVGKSTRDLNGVVFRETACSTDDPCNDTRTCANALRCWDHDGSVVGLTTTSYSTKTGVVYDSDIELNAAGYLFTTVAAPPCTIGHESVACVATDLQNTVTHEIGHLVGLDHVLNVTSTMAKSTFIGETQKRIIDFGTQGGFCSTYPRAQPPVPCDQLAQVQRRIVARNTGSFGCSCAELDGLLPLAVLALLGHLRKRR